MIARIRKKIGPYQGPFERVITYKLELNNNKIIIWHENGKRNFPNLENNEIIDGLVIKKNKNNYVPDYNKSKIKKYNNQILMF